MKLRTWVSGYFALQAVAVALWWVSLVVWPGLTPWFHPQSWPAAVLSAFALPDAMILVIGSGLTAISIKRRWRWAPLAAWMVAGGTSYATLYCLAASLRTGEAWTATSAMSMMTGITLSMASVIGSDSMSLQTIRPVRMPRASAIFFTFVQTVIFWSLFLWILPQTIVRWEHHFDLPTFAPIPLAAAGFLAFSLLGLSSGVVMAVKGQGTPLPTATAVDFVIAGPYRHVRNPMALAGIAQGIFVGAWLGSYLVILYSIAGAVLWHLFVRPVEEADLSERFGASYDRYRDHVRLWVPGRRYDPYRSTTDATS